MILTWAAGAAVILAASFVMGLAGFGIGLVSLAFLPFLMPPATAVALMTLYAFVFAVILLFQLRRDVVPGALAALLVGTVAGTPVGVLALATLPAGILKRLIGAMLLVAVALEWRGRYPAGVRGPGWGLGAGVLAGALGGAVGTPGPPVILYAAAQRWPPRTIKANLQAFFAVNQAVILTGYWWAGLLTAEVWRFSALFAVPAAVGLAAGALLFRRVDQVLFRRIVFALLLVAGLTLLAGG